MKAALRDFVDESNESRQVRRVANPIRSYLFGQLLDSSDSRNLKRMCELQQGVTVNFSIIGNSMDVLLIDSFSAPILVIDNTDVAATISREKWAGQLQSRRLRLD